MIELSLSPSMTRGGYAARRKRPRSALVAAIALNGGAFALIMALPATRYIVERTKGVPTIDFPIDPTPPQIKPDPKPKELVPLQRHDPVPRADPDTPTVVDPIVPLAAASSVAAAGNIDQGGVGDTRPVERPVHNPVFVRANPDPRYAAAFHPDYPPALRRAGLEGSATVRITIDGSGKVIACELVKATDAAFFDETRVQALRYWRFRPATSDGAPIQSQQVLTVQFRLEGV